MRTYIFFEFLKIFKFEFLNFRKEKIMELTGDFSHIPVLKRFKRNKREALVHASRAAAHHIVS
jgi:hypothetical protein